MCRIEGTLGLLTAVLGLSATGILAASYITLSAVHMSINLLGTMLVVGASFSYAGVLSFSRRHCREQKFAYLVGLIASTAIQIAVVSVTATGAGVFLIPSALLSLFLVAVALTCHTRGGDREAH